MSVLEAKMVRAVVGEGLDGFRGELVKYPGDRNVDTKGELDLNDV